MRAGYSKKEDLTQARAVLNANESSAGTTLLFQVNDFENLNSKSHSVSHFFYGGLASKCPQSVDSEQRGTFAKSIAWACSCCTTIK